ncbi:hypothetical protein [Neisseria sp.]|uniref:hypothetical protein n=1 Tax=Neisseria sp. TaxID=192066 RepID=UPI0035A14E4C
MDAEQTVEKIDAVLEMGAMLTERYQQQMEEATDRMQRQLDESLAQYKKELTAFATENIKTDLDRVLRQYRQDMDETHETMVHRSKEFNTYLHLVTEENRKIARKAWIGTTVCLVCMVSMLFCGVWLAAHYADRIKENKAAAEITELLAKSDIVRCGGSLCAKTDKAGRDGYRTIKLK